MAQSITLLGLESSCDDTAAAVVRRSTDGHAEVLSNIVVGQNDLHKAFGGVVPEIAARAHAEQHFDIRMVEKAHLDIYADLAQRRTANP